MNFESGGITSLEVISVEAYDGHHFRAMVKLLTGVNFKERAYAAE